MPSLHKRERSKYWIAAYTLPDGRRTKRSTKQTNKKAAWRIALELEAAAEKAKGGAMTEQQARELASQIFELSSGRKLELVSVKAYVESWLKRKEAEVSESSMQEYSTVARHWLKHLGKKADQPLEAITFKDAMAYRGVLLERVSAKTASKYMKTMRMIFTAAEKEQVLQKNVFKLVDLPKVEQSIRRGFDESELETLIKYVSGEWRGLVLFGLYTGQRLGDLASLTWRHIDLVENEIHLTTQKTHRHMTLPILKPIADYLASLESSDNPDGALFPEAYAFACRAGNVNTLSRQFTEILKDCGIRTGSTSHKTSGTGKGRNTKREKSGLSFHSLRHSTTTLLKQAGVSDAIARAIIGHESEAISRQYTHLDSATIKDAMEKLKDITEGAE